VINAPVLRTLLVCDLAESTAIVEKLGDRRAAELMRQHDRLSRDLIIECNGLEIDKTDGFLLLFERPIHAVNFALEYQRRLKDLGVVHSITLQARIGIHVGEIVLWQNEAADIAHGAKPVEAEGLVKPAAARLMGIARPGQILLSGTAHALALRARSELGDGRLLRWRAHGSYRFKGVRDPVQVFEVGEESIAPFKSPAWSGKAQRVVPWWRRSATLALAALVALLLAAVPAYHRLHNPPAIAFAKRDWVVLGDFKNLNGGSILDVSLQTAFRLGLEESRHVNVLSPLEVHDALERMQRDPERTTIDRAVGSELAIREGARALILPFVQQIQGHVRITAEVVDPHTLATVYTESADGNGTESLLACVDRVNEQLRLRLGEALGAVSSDSQPLEKVTTKNLDALRAYSLGLRAYAQSRQADARGLFQQAVSLDPDFALAYIGMARTYYSNDDLVPAKAYMEKAATLKDRLSVRDRLYLDAWLAGFGPSGPSLQKWKLLGELYPDDYAAAYNYAYFAWQFENRAADAIIAIQPALSEHNPQRSGAYYMLASLEAADNQFDAAYQHFDIAAALTKFHADSNYRAAAYAAQRRFTEADRLLSQAQPRGIATNDVLARREVIVEQVDRGNWDPARAQINEHAADAAKVGPIYDLAYRAMALSLDDYAGPSEAHAIALRSFIVGARKAWEAAPEADRQDTMFATVFGAYLAAHAGETALARSTLAATAPRIHNSGYTNLEHLQAIAEAEVESRNGHAKDAIELLAPTVDGAELYLTHAALADAYAAAHRNADAFREAEWLAAHRGRAYLEINSLQILEARNVIESDLALLRMAELSQAMGREGEARQHLAAFEAAWPGNLQPPFAAARAAKLRESLQLPPKQ